MTNEEIQLKLGLDASSFSTGLRNMQRETDRAGEHVHGSFLHAQSSARGFHKVLEQLNDSIPGLGTAFTALANPITAAFLGAAALIAGVRGKLKEFNAEMDRQGAEAAKPIWSREQMIALKNEIAAAHKEYREFLKSLRPSQVSAETEAITGEKDETKRVRQARAFQTRIKEQLDASAAELKSLDEKLGPILKEKKVLPTALEATREYVKIEKTKRIPILNKAGEAVAFDIEAEEKRDIMLDHILRRMEARKEDNDQKVLEHTERRKELETSIKEKQEAIGHLTKVREEGEMSEMEEQFYLGTKSTTGSATFKVREDLRQNRIPRNEGNAANASHALGELLRLHEKWDNGGIPMQPKMGE